MGNLKVYEEWKKIAGEDEEKVLIIKTFSLEELLIQEDIKLEEDGTRTKLLVYRTPEKTEKLFMLLPVVILEGPMEEELLGKETLKVKKGEIHEKGDDYFFESPLGFHIPNFIIKEIKEK